jgi:hypothetical protein
MDFLISGQHISPIYLAALGFIVGIFGGQTGAAVGAQIGVVLTRFFRGPKIRLAFSPLPLVGAALVAYGTPSEVMTIHQAVTCHL